MTKPIRVLLQTTIPFTEDDWHVGRFSLLRDELASSKDESGNSRFEVVSRNRESDSAGNDPVLSTLDTSDFDELWLFAVDTGDGLTTADCQGITRFRQRGGGILATRDHQDLGTSLCTLGGVGRAHFFHSKNPEPDASRHIADDPYTTSISWPNYHSGANGDYQTITVESPHALLRKPDNGWIEFSLLIHTKARSVSQLVRTMRALLRVATVKSRIVRSISSLLSRIPTTDHGNTLGRGIAESSFHHFADYNWDPAMGCPIFVAKPPGDGYKRNPQALKDIKTYVNNAASWLAGS